MKGFPANHVAGDYQSDLPGPGHGSNEVIIARQAISHLELFVSAASDHLCQMVS